MTGDRWRRLHPVAVITLLALVPAVLLAMLWRGAASRAEDESDLDGAFARPGGEPLTTPLLSFRRLPALVARDVSLPAFESAVAALAATIGETSCLAVALDGAPVEGTASRARSVIPASNQKLLIAAVALEVLGPRARFTTEVRAGPTEDGVVTGDLYLVGGGDPLLTSGQYPVEDDRYPVTDATSLDALADAVVAAGIDRVEGSVVGDGGRYDDEWFVPSWDDDVHGIEAGPYDALLVNDARVTGDPTRAADPALGAARELTALLTARGIEVAGEPAVGTSPADADDVASVTSAPMTAVVAELLGTSDNNTAEMLVKELGVAAGKGGSREAGLEVVRRTLADWGIDDVTLADGSGLSNDNRVTCEALVGVLERHRPDGPLGSGLAVAGRSGTLADLFEDTDVAGRMRAKTGTLGNAPVDVEPPAVKALAGYVTVERGGVIEFALVLNEPGPLTDPDIYLPTWNALATTLSTYPTGPTPADLAPR